MQKPVTIHPASQGLSRRPLVAIVDAHSGGHHAMYAAGYLWALLQIGCDVMVIAPQTLLDALPADSNDGASVRRVSLDVAGRLPPQAGPEECAEMLWQALGQTLTVEATASGRYPSVVLLLYLDAFVSELLRPDVAACAVSCPVMGLWFKPPQTLSVRWREQIRRFVRLGRRYRLFRSPRFAALLLLDATAARSIPVQPPRIITVPEFTDVTLPATRPPVVDMILERAAGRRICCLVGSIDQRKGIRGFLEAATAAPAEEWFFMIAGSVVWDALDAEVVGALRGDVVGSRPNLMLVDEWLQAETLNAIIAASDLLYACYEDWPYSSNMLCKAAGLGTPVLARDEGYIGRNVRRFGLGVLISPRERIARRFTDGFAEAVASLAASPAFKSGCREYLSANDPAALVVALEPVIREVGCQ
ncbi:MAG: glycosyltransferase family 4 protein [Planctomycetes bacterium]|nr:glycosyltransferase family 4 protein [Planctomycetota bacterium]